MKLRLRPDSGTPCHDKACCQYEYFAETGDMEHDDIVNEIYKIENFILHPYHTSFMKIRQLIVTLLFTIFSALAVGGCCWLFLHGEVLGNEAKGYFYTAVFLAAFFLFPTIILWVKLLKRQ